MIKPTIGRVVWFHPEFMTDSGANEETYAAIICYVHSDELVSLSVFDANGCQFSVTPVPLFQGEGVRPGTRYCEWMPYQIEQAKAAIS